MIEYKNECEIVLVSASPRPPSMIPTRDARMRIRNEAETEEESGTSHSLSSSTDMIMMKLCFAAGFRDSLPPSKCCVDVEEVLTDRPRRTNYWVPFFAGIVQ